MNYKDELYHYGVPGMRWGQRRMERKLERHARKYNKIELAMEKNVLKRVSPPNGHSGPTIMIVKNSDKQQKLIYKMRKNEKKGRGIN